MALSNEHVPLFILAWQGYPAETPLPFHPLFSFLSIAMKNKRVFFYCVRVKKLPTNQIVTTK